MTESPELRAAYSRLTGVERGSRLRRARLGRTFAPIPQRMLFPDSATEPLLTRGYGKTLVFTLATSTP